MRTRTVRKNFFLSEHEASRLKELAMAAKISEADLVRNMILGYQLCEKPDAEFYQILNNLGKIGTNINQIAARANATGKVDTEWMQEMFREIVSLREMLQERYLLPEKQK